VTFPRYTRERNSQMPVLGRAPWFLSANEMRQTCTHIGINSWLLCFSAHARLVLWHVMPILHTVRTIASLSIDPGLSLTGVPDRDITYTPRAMYLCFVTRLQMYILALLNLPGGPRTLCTFGNCSCIRMAST
jgi:hypothetical protein